MTKYFTLDEMIDGLQTEVIYKSTDHDEIKIYSSEVNRPGLQLTGYYPRFSPTRVQVLGNAEWQYLKDMTGTERRFKLLELTRHPIPVLVFTANNYIFDEVIDICMKNDVTLLRSKEKTSKLINDLYNFALKKLAPKTSVHGVLVEVYGSGVLLTGKSGVGKSETALDLVRKGHKLVSDDVVEITKINDILVGESPELTRHFMEIRGVGILDIERLYGVSAVKTDQDVDLIIELENWDDEKEYDRAGFDENYTELLGVNLPTITIPMKPGRNTAMIIEVATRNLLQKKLGYNAAEELNKKILKKINMRASLHKKKI